MSNVSVKYINICLALKFMNRCYLLFIALIMVFRISFKDILNKIEHGTKTFLNYSSSFRAIFSPKRV